MTSNHRPERRLPASSMARYGCYLGLVASLLMLGYALSMLGGGSDDPMPFKISFLIGGVLEGAMSLFALRRSRASWSFALSLNGTLSVVFLFGAPKVRDGFDVSIYIGLMPAVVFAVITTLLALGAEDY